MKRNKRFKLILLAIFIFILAACGGDEEEPPATEPATLTPAPPSPTPEPPTPTPQSEPIYALADVDSIEILGQEEGSDVLNVRLRGIFPNGCTEIDEIVTQQEGDTFSIAVTTVQQPGQDCTEEEVPFDETVGLDVSQLTAGTYFVRANDLQGSFNLEAAPESGSQEAAAVASLDGRVWHDLCAVSAEEGAELNAGCITTETGEVQANGLFEDEPGIEGIEVSYGEGECPAEATATATTDEDGNYRFEELAPGTYCVFVDVTAEGNQEILLPGQWTSPEDGVPELTVTLIGGETLEAVDFGWDYQFLPIADFDPETCTNTFEFVEDLNIPDDTVYAPGAELTKRWLLRNNGSCPWTEEYSIVFIGGDQMSAEPEIPIETPVAPGQELEVSIDMVAPDEPGTYRGNWQVADANGEPFGINGFIEDAFWLRIVVEEGAAPAATAAPNSGTIAGVVWDDFCLNSDPGTGCVEFPEGSGIYIANGSLSPNESVLSEITIILAEGRCPADGSRPPADTIIDSAVTDDRGLYRFENVAEGTYCVYMDALSDENVNALIPGNWTYPTTGVGRYLVIVAPGEQVLDIDFGWDYAD